MVCLRWTGHKQDVVEQMLVGLGWRVTGYSQSVDTRTMAVTSSDDEGVKRPGVGWDILLGLGF